MAEKTETIRVRQTIHQRAKIEAVLRGTNLGAFTEDALEERMDKPESFWTAIAAKPRRTKGAK